MKRICSEGEIDVLTDLSCLGNWKFSLLFVSRIVRVSVGSCTLINNI